MHGAVLLDGANHVLRPCMLWNDTRAHVEAAEIESDPRFRAITGNIVFACFTAPKVEWVRRNEPEVFAKIAKIVLPKDFLRMNLAGGGYCDMSDASGTAWFDPSTRDWSDTLLSACGLTRDHMPNLAEGSAATGRIKGWIQGDLAMAQAPTAAGAGDNAAAAIGAGVVKDGTGFVSLGTSGVLFAANSTYRPDPETAVHTFCHALPDTWHQMGVILAATDALNWLSTLTGQSASDLTRDLDPNTALTPAFTDAHARYRAAYTTLKDL